MKKQRLLKHFTFFSFIAFLITGTLIVLFITDHMKNDKIHETMTNAKLAMYYAVEQELSLVQFDRAFSESKADDFNTKLQPFIDNNNIIEISIINKSGAIIYSNNKNLIRKSVTIDKHLSDSFENKSHYEILEMLYYRSGKIIKSDVVKMFIPINSNKDVIGIYEIIMPYDNIQEHISSVNKRVILIILIGLLVLYLFLIKIINDTSKKLVYQNDELLKKTRELEESYSKLDSAYKNTVLTLSSAVDARDPYTAGHTERVAKLSVKIGNVLNLSEEQMKNLELAALFHDIGKIGVPDCILYKPGNLTIEEFSRIKDHPTIGVSILKNIDFLSRTLPIILHHHEKFDGNGYPYGLKGGEIPIEARIIAVSDTFDAITSDRPYRKGQSKEYAVSEIIKFQGLQFDQKIVQAFLKVIDQ